MMYIPKNFAHGYLTLEPNILIQWCVDADFCADAVRYARWNTIEIPCPGNIKEYVISEEDTNGIKLKE